ncbi:hypothetical protein [Flavobacterium sp.]|uniref:hypothetical protein n=1 Tax=Flavobacterium sp. TaxID=239 RepID=UPI00261C99F8|nr:hypothetical protein [Flavobacterium sp.]MDD3004850.1 hypothetical protein [Flavobacterium sp.]
MNRLTIYLVVTLCFFLTKINAQTGETFEMRVRRVALKIEKSTKEEKATLKKEVEEVNVQLEQGKISAEEAEQQKKSLAAIRAKNIENRVAEHQNELNDIVQLKVNGNISDTDTIKTRSGFTLIWNPKLSTKRDSITPRGESRTTSQFVFAMGLNNLMTKGALANSDYRYWGSHFYEWGVTWNTRLAKNDNLLHFKYGFSVMYNNLRPTENRFFVDNGTTTDLETNPVNMRDSRFRNVNLVFPMHLEFDFTPKKVKNDKTYFKTHESFRFGIGGFTGFNVKSKQILKYDIDGYKTRSVTKGSFNTNDFIYGLSTYVGYKSTSVYLKYDISPLFKDNAVDQNNISLGLRFDFN